jgi:uncharacterized membrane protein YdbT with pleckstrin-like domain
MGYVEQLLAPDERVLLRTRRHWIVLLRWVGGALVLAALGLAMASIFGFFGGYQGAGTGAWVGVGLALVGLLLALPAWLRWANEIYLVTDRRVIQVEGVLKKRALDSGLSKVNDVRLTQSFGGRLLGYGDLEIITAAESGINRLDELPRPLAFKKAMMAAAEGRPPAALDRQGVATSPPPEPTAGRGGAARTAADRLAELDELRRRGLLSEQEYANKRAEILNGL